MTYTKNTWVDQAGQVKYTKTDDGSYWILTPYYGDVTELGTPVNATNMNHIEDGIEALQTEVTAIYPKIDGQWVTAGVSGVQVVTNLNIHDNNSTPYPVDISAYLPNDNYSYEILIDGLLESSSTSGQYAALIVVGAVEDVHICNARPRTNSTFTSAGNAIIVVDATRKFNVLRAQNYYGTVNITLCSYRRIGTNA